LKGKLQKRARLVLYGRDGKMRCGRGIMRSHENASEIFFGVGVPEGGCFGKRGGRRTILLKSMAMTKGVKATGRV